MLLETAAPVDVEFYNQGARVAQAGQVEQGYYSDNTAAFDRIVITTATPQTLKIAISDGRGGYNRLAGTVSATIVKALAVSELAPVSVGVAATLVAAANANRRGLRLYNGGTVTVLLGGSGVSLANGVIQVAPGQTWVEDDAPAAAWYGISGTAGQSMRVQELI